MVVAIGTMTVVVVLEDLKQCAVYMKWIMLVVNFKTYTNINVESQWGTALVWPLHAC